MVEQVQVSRIELDLSELSEEEKEQLAFELLASLPPEKVEQILNNFYLIDKFIRGEPLKPGQLFHNLINVEDIRERSRFPTTIDIKFQTYARLIYALYGEAAKPLLEWANQEAHVYISYKGLGRDEAIEMAKASRGVELLPAMIYPERKGEEVSAQPAKKGLFARIKEKLAGSKGEEE